MFIQVKICQPLSGERQKARQLLHLGAAANFQKQPRQLRDFSSAPARATLSLYW